MIPSHNGTHCLLPGRIDVAQHFIRTGGVQVKGDAHRTEKQKRKKTIIRCTGAERTIRSNYIATAIVCGIYF